MKETQEDWNSVWDRGELLFTEALEVIDQGVKKALAHLPPLEERYRGQERLFRYLEKNVNVALALKLVQLRGNIHAGTALVENGHYLEWDMIQRSMQDSHEDVSFLVFCEHNKTGVFRRYLESFFDEDLDKDGEFTDRRKVGGVERREVRKVLAEEERKLNLSKDENGYEMESRKFHRIRSGSVHGRAASIMRANVVEVIPGQGRLWLGGERALNRAKFEYLSLLIAATMTVSSFLVAGVGRWWDSEFVKRTFELCERMRVTTQCLNQSVKSSSSVGS